MERKPSLIPFITAGDPDLNKTLDFLKIMDRYADVIELGIPFSDPIADGKTIQMSSARALGSGTSMAGVLDVVSKFKEGSDTPIVVMTYYNLIYHMGLDSFLAMAKEKGVDGIIIVDLPLEESSEYRRLCEETGLKTIFLAAPNTSLERIRDIDEASTGFVYLVAHLGTTGERENIPASTLELLGKAKRICKRPVAVGFGVSSPTHVAQLAQAGADAIIVGSSIVKLIEEYGRDAGPYIDERLRSYEEAMKSRMEKV
ncbi:MAG: tryptophan synthase subunit alpha [Candidatus Methanofastidiosa archaeon]|nr:tryptophan synthase subunit alpha [Candidatus Methanofastidiosa archaeon]